MYLGITGVVCGQLAVAANYEWRVENFFSLPGSRLEWYHSPDIQFAGRTFHFRLHPTCDIYLLYLLLKRPSPPIKIRYTIGIKTATGDIEMQKNGTQEFSARNDCVCHVCMVRSELWDRRQELVPRDALTFKVSLMIDVSLPGADFATFCQNIEELKGKDSDVTLEVRGIKFRVHKFILEVRTPTLAAMFSDNASAAETAVVCVKDCHPEAFEVFLRFVYSGVAENLDSENVTDVYYVANKYDLPELKKECVRYMLSNLTTGSVCSFIDMADRHGEDLLKERATEFLVENAREIFRTAVWRKFTEENSLAYDLIERVHKNWK